MGITGEKAMCSAFSLRTDTFSTMSTSILVLANLALDISKE